MTGRADRPKAITHWRSDPVTRKILAGLAHLTSRSPIATFGGERGQRRGKAARRAPNSLRASSSKL